MTDKNLWWKMLLVVVIAGLAALMLYPPTQQLKGGIDLVGGYSLLYEIDTAGLEDEQITKLAERVMMVLKDRVDPKGQRNLEWRPIGKGGTLCAGYLDSRRLVIPHLKAIENTWRSEGRTSLGRLLLDALSAWNLGDVSHQDLNEGALRSLTGQLRRDSSSGVFTVDTPRFQAAVGFIGGRRIEFGTMTVDVATRHCAVALTSLDDKPIADSQHLLLAAIGQAVNTGQQAERTLVTHMGLPPVLYRPVQGSVLLKTDWAAEAVRVQACDTDGQAIEAVQTKRVDEGLWIPMESSGSVAFYEIEHRGTA